jgi:hypothetical protein
MNVDEAIEHFANADEFPREALQWALDNWEDASPRFISKLRAYAEGAPESEVDLDGLFFIIQLCGVKHDTRAYVPLCDVIAADTTFYDKFGGGMVDNLPGILINVCDGDVEPLKRAIEAPEGDEFCRAAAIEALAYLVRTRSVLSDEEMQRYLSHLGSELQPRGENQIWSAWAFAIAQLGYRTLRAEAGRVFAREWIGPCAGTLDEFDQALQLARRGASFRSDRRSPRSRIDPPSPPSHCGSAVKISIFPRSMAIASGTESCTSIRFAMIIRWRRGDLTERRPTKSAGPASARTGVQP